jgi:hypothetical protein
MFKLKHEPLARRSQFFMNLIICSFRRIHVIIDLTFGVSFAPQITQMDTDVLSCHAFFSHRFFGLHGLLSSQATMTDEQNIPHGRSHRGSNNPCNPKNLCVKKICVHLQSVGRKTHPKLELLKLAGGIMVIIQICFK